MKTYSKKSFYYSAILERKINPKQLWKFLNSVIHTKRSTNCLPRRVNVIEWRGDFCDFCMTSFYSETLQQDLVTLFNIATFTLDLVTLLQSGKISFSPCDWHFSITSSYKSLASVMNMGRIPLFTKLAISPSTARYSFSKSLNKSGRPLAIVHKYKGVSKLAIATK